LREKPDDPAKTCCCCHQEKPLNAKHFHRNRYEKDRFNKECRECRNRNRREARGSEKEKQRRQRVDQFIDDIRSGKIGPEVRPVAEEIFAHFGGAEGIAKDFIAHFHLARPGSREKFRVIQTMLNLIEKCDKAHPPEGDFSQMTDEDLKQILDESVARLIASGTVDVGETRDADSPGGRLPMNAEQLGDVPT
jgi:hypothetical protein